MASRSISPTPRTLTLKPGKSVVVVAHRAAFQSRYGVQIPIAGEYTGRLANEGEQLVLRDRWGGVLSDFQYDDAWYPRTDGAGYSLTAVDPSLPSSEASDAAYWRPSDRPGGSPGKLPRARPARRLRRRWAASTPPTLICSIR